MARAAHALEIYVNPYRQDKIPEDGQRSSTFELINGPYLYPRTVPLFEEDLVSLRLAGGLAGTLACVLAYLLASCRTLYTHTHLLAFALWLIGWCEQT